MTTTDIIDGTFRVVATTPLTRRSPNRARMAVRIAFWNVAAVACLVALPILF